MSQFLVRSSIRRLTTVVGLAGLLLLSPAGAVPQPKRKKGGKELTAQQQAAQIPDGISTATDGSTILDQTVQINGLPIRFKTSAPAELYTTSSGVQGGQAVPGAAGKNAINVLLHGDGGQSFFDFPNQAVQANTLGVAVLAPDPNLFWGGGSGLNRTDGVPHAQAVNDLIQQTLPNVFAFDPQQVFFTGVSGGSLLLSGFFIPAQLANFPGNGVLLNCGALEPQVAFNNASAVVSNTRIHFQSTQHDLSELQESIPVAINAYEALATGAGLSNAQVGQLQTANNEPNGGHCEFDGKDFVSGVQLMANSFSNIIQGGNGQVDGVGSVTQSVVGLKLAFQTPADQEN